eukprot:scaffold255603_cov33-Tisochrysis_lutea.AAC.2
MAVRRLRVAEDSKPTTFSRKRNEGSVASSHEPSSWINLSSALARPSVPLSRFRSRRPASPCRVYG